MTDWNVKLAEWRSRYDCKVLPPVSTGLLDEVSKSLSLPPSFVGFYKHCNGLTCEWFRFFPISDPSSPKKTWDSLDLANSKQSRYFNGDVDFLSRFLVFADISGGQCASCDRNDESIWYQEDELHQTDMTLEEFIEMSLREVAEL